MLQEIPPRTFPTSVVSPYKVVRLRNRQTRGKDIQQYLISLSDKNLMKTHCDVSLLYHWESWWYHTVVMTLSDKESKQCYVARTHCTVYGSRSYSDIVFCWRQSLISWLDMLKTWVFASIFSHSRWRTPINQAYPHMQAHITANVRQKTYSWWYPVSQNQFNIIMLIQKYLIHFWEIDNFEIIPSLYF